MDNNNVVNIEPDTKKNLISGCREIYVDEGNALRIIFEGWFKFKDTTGECVPRLCELHLIVDKEQYFESLHKRTSYTITPTNKTYWTFTLEEEE
jgi:hypothetical protein